MHTYVLHVHHCISPNYFQHDSAIEAHNLHIPNLQKLLIILDYILIWLSSLKLNLLEDVLWYYRFDCRLEDRNAFSGLFALADLENPWVLSTNSGQNIPVLMTNLGKYGIQSIPCDGQLISLESPCLILHYISSQWHLFHIVHHAHLVLVPVNLIQKGKKFKNVMLPFSFSVCHHHITPSITTHPTFSTIGNLML